MCGRRKASKKSLEPRLKRAQQGRRKVFFVDAAHFVHSLYLGVVWCFERLFVPAPSGRKRLNILAALDAVSHELITVHNHPSITADSVCCLLVKLRASTDLPITVVLDNARYQRCGLVAMLARNLNIELLFLPPYSPNLNLIERFWRFLRKKCLYSQYYPDFNSFKAAILDVIAKAPTEYKEELDELLTLKFQVFKKVPLLPGVALEPAKPKAQPAVKKAKRKQSRAKAKPVGRTRGKKESCTTA